MCRIQNCARLTVPKDISKLCRKYFEDFWSLQQVMLSYAGKQHYQIKSEQEYRKKKKKGQAKAKRYVKKNEGSRQKINTCNLKKIGTQ